MLKEVYNQGPSTQQSGYILSSQHLEMHADLIATGQYRIGVIEMNQGILQLVIQEGPRHTSVAETTGYKGDKKA